MIGEASLLDSIKNGRAFKRRTAMLTFDDGYLDNYELAYPILSDLNVPAIFFVSCNQVEGKVLAWWDQIAFMIKHSQNDSISFGGITVAAGGALPEAGDSVNKMLTIFKRIPTGQVNESLKTLSELCDVPLPEDDDIKCQFMNWEQLREVSRGGITIGSHSMNHRILSQLSIEDQQWELEESKKILEETIGQTVNSLAYPVGGKSPFNQQTKKIAKESGYQMGFSYI